MTLISKKSKNCASQVNLIFRNNRAGFNCARSKRAPHLGPRNHGSKLRPLSGGTQKVGEGSRVVMWFPSQCRSVTCICVFPKTWPVGESYRMICRSANLVTETTDLKNTQVWGFFCGGSDGQRWNFLGIKTYLQKFLLEQMQWFLCSETFEKSEITDSWKLWKCEQSLGMGNKKI